MPSAARLSTAPQEPRAADSARSCAAQTLTVLLSVAVTLLPHAAAAEPVQKMSFRNNLLPGQLTVHRLTRTVTREAVRKQYTETLRYRQEAEWVQCNIEENKPGNIMLYQMLVEQPAQVLSVRQGQKKIQPTPPASDFGIVQGSPALRSAYRTPRDSPAQTPLGDPAERAVLNALLDFAHWPSKQIDAGHKWERDLLGGGIAGTQRFEFVDVTEMKGRVIARVALSVQGRFEDALAKDYEFGRGQAIIYWSRLDRTPIKIEAQADYQRRRDNAPEKYRIKLDVHLVRQDSLGEQARETVIDQMLLFAQAQKAHREGNDREAFDACLKFRQTWPDAVWTPAVQELQDRIRPRKAAESPRLTSAELNDLLVKCFVAYEAARTNYEYDLLNRTRETLCRLVERQRAALLKIAKGDDSGRRGRAVFALAFSDRLEDLRFVEKAARDDHPGVRAMALAALAARRHPDTSVELVIIMLDDAEVRVRRRACEAVAACVPPEHYSVVKAVERLGELMIEDDDAGVRLEAIRAVGAVGAPADIPKLEEALKSELNDQNRAEIDKAVARLRAKSG